MNLDLASLLTMFGTATMVLMQTLIKPLFDRFPGVTLKVNQGLHDNLLRFIQYAVNLAFLIAAAKYGGSTLFNSWRWWDFLGATFGSAVVSQAVYAFGSQGSSPLVESSTPPASMADVLAMTHSSTPAPFLTPSPDIPTVPRT